MGVTLRNYLGNTLPPNGKVEDVRQKYSTKTVVHEMGASDSDVIQKMGIKNKRYSIKGFIENSNGWGFLEDAVNHTGSIYYTSSAMGVPINKQVFYYDLDCRDVGGRPLEREFTINAIEVK